MKKNIVLIGFMGSGKTMVAQELAKQLKAEVFATDDLVEITAQEKINDIFATKGESYFRKLENEVINSISTRQGVIIDCGGGAVLVEENLQLLKTNGIVFYLKASLEVIYARIAKETHRPLLKVPDPLGHLRRLYQKRLPLYEKADYIIDANDASIEGPIQEILKKI